MNSGRSSKERAVGREKALGMDPMGKGWVDQVWDGHSARCSRLPTCLLKGETEMGLMAAKESLP